MTTQTILFVDEDPAARAQTIAGFRRVLGSTFIAMEGCNILEADIRIFESLADHSRLPTIAVIEYLIPDEQGIYMRYPQLLNEIYPEIRIVLITHQPRRPAEALHQKGIPLLAVLDKPWSPQNFAVLERSLVFTL
jgi:hypothetical protein